MLRARAAARTGSSVPHRTSDRCAPPIRVSSTAWDSRDAPAVARYVAGECARRPAGGLVAATTRIPRRGPRRGHRTSRSPRPCSPPTSTSRGRPRRSARRSSPTCRRSTPPCATDSRATAPPSSRGRVASAASPSCGASEPRGSSGAAPVDTCSRRRCCAPRASIPSAISPTSSFFGSYGDALRAVVADRGDFASVYVPSPKPYVVLRPMHDLVGPAPTSSRRSRSLAVRRATAWSSRAGSPRWTVKMPVDWLVPLIDGRESGSYLLLLLEAERLVRAGPHAYAALRLAFSPEPRDASVSNDREGATGRIRLVVVRR